VAAVQRIPGIGKKTASRIILELKGSLDQGLGGLFADQEAPSSAALEGASEALLSMGEAAAEPMLAALASASETAKDIFADVLSNYPGDDRIFNLLMERFQNAQDQKALFASYLAKFGDERALPRQIPSARTQTRMERFEARICRAGAARIHTPPYAGSDLIGQHAGPLRSGNHFPVLAARLLQRRAVFSRFSFLHAGYAPSHAERT